MQKHIMQFSRKLFLKKLTPLLFASLLVGTSHAGQEHAKTLIGYNGGAVFSTGSITWISSTLDNNYEHDVAAINRCVIDRFLAPAPFIKLRVEDVDRTPENPEHEFSDQG